MRDEAPPFPDTGAYARARDRLLERIIDLLEHDSRVAVAWLAGSLGRGQADAWADLDLRVVVADEHYGAFLDERPHLYERVGRPVLIQPELPQNSALGGRFQLVVYAGALHVDWDIGPLSLAVRPAACRILVERVTIPVMQLPAATPEARRERAAERLAFFWALAPVGVKYAGRYDSQRAVSQIALLTPAYIALWRLATDPGSLDTWPSHTNRALEPELERRLPRLGVHIDPLAALDVVRALCAEVEALHPALEMLGVPIPAEMPGEVTRLAALAEAVIRRDDRLKRTFS